MGHLYSIVSGIFIRFCEQYFLHGLLLLENDTVKWLKIVWHLNWMLWKQCNSFINSPDQIFSKIGLVLTVLELFSWGAKCMLIILWKMSFKSTRICETSKVGLLPDFISRQNSQSSLKCVDVIRINSSIPSRRTPCIMHTTGASFSIRIDRNDN